MRTNIVTLPSGLKGVVRGLKTKELNLLADEAALNSGMVTNDLIRACWHETLEPGFLKQAYFPEATEESLGRLDWDNVLLDDRFVALYMANRTTWKDPVYRFSFECAVCGKATPHSINLDTDLDFRFFSEAVMQQYLDGNEFRQEMLHDGKSYKFKLLTGKEERQMQRAIRQNPKQRVSIALWSRIIDIEGIRKPERLAYLEELEAEDEQDLAEQINEYAAGYETIVEGICQGCGHDNDVEVPFDSAWWIRRTQTRRKRLS